MNDPAPTELRVATDAMADITRDIVEHLIRHGRTHAAYDLESAWVRLAKEIRRTLVPVPPAPPEKVAGAGAETRVPNSGDPV